MIDFKKLEDYWYVLCESSDVKNKPKSFKLLNKDIVVYRNSENKVIAFVDMCPHRNVPMSDGYICNGNLVCGFHGWEFNDEGTCVKVPGMMEREKVRAARLRKYNIVEEKGLVFICLNPKSEKTHYIPNHMSNPEMTTYTFRTHLKCGILNLAENFLDPFHTPFVHAGIIRTESKRYRNEITPRHIEDGIEVAYKKDKPQSGFIALFGPPIDNDLGRFRMPGTVELEYYNEKTLAFVNTMYMTPRTDKETSIYFKASLRPYRIPLPLVHAIAGQAIKFALNQDKVILGKQTEMIEKYGGEFYAHTELDIVRKQLENLYSFNDKKVDFQPLEAMI